MVNGDSTDNPHVYTGCISQFRGVYMNKNNHINDVEYHKGNSSQRI